jgi:hypothetical protein
MKFNSNLAIKLFIGLLIVVVLFHICIVVKIIPYSITWGGRLQNDSEMYVFESFSILVNIFLALVLLMKGKLIRFTFSEKALNTILWIFCFLFILNTLGNLFAQTSFEKLFSILTGISALLLWKILKKQ